MNEDKIPSKCLLKQIPPEVYQFVQQEQSRIKQEKRTNQYSFESTIYKMLRDYKRCLEYNNFNPSAE